MKTVNQKQWEHFTDHWSRKAWEELTNANTLLDLMVNRFERTVIIVNKRTGKTSIARCHPNDEFCVGVGVAIAFAKWHGVQIPNVERM